MWKYEKCLMRPVKISHPDPASAVVIMSQLGGPHGEMGAADRYLSQRFSVPYGEIAGILTDVGTEELAHIEMVATLITQLTRNLSIKEIEDKGFAPYFVDHTTGVYPQSAAGTPYSAAAIASTGDLFADLNDDLAADGAHSLLQTFPRQNPLIFTSSCYIISVSALYRFVREERFHE